MYVNQTTKIMIVPLPHPVTKPPRCAVIKGRHRQSTSESTNYCSTAIDVHPDNANYTSIYDMPTVLPGNSYTDSMKLIEGYLVWLFGSRIDIAYSWPTVLGMRD